MNIAAKFKQSIPLVVTCCALSGIALAESLDVVSQFVHDVKTVEELSIARENKLGLPTRFGVVCETPVRCCKSGKYC